MISPHFHTSKCDYILYYYNTSNLLSINILSYYEPISFCLPKPMEGNGATQIYLQKLPV